MNMKSLTTAAQDTRCTALAVAPVWQMGSGVVRILCVALITEIVPIPESRQEAQGPETVLILVIK